MISWLQMMLIFHNALKEYFYLNAHAQGVFNSAIRGQFIQRFTTPVGPSEVVSPMKGKTGASGTAKITVEAAGSTLCIDATIKGFDPVVAYLNYGKVGTNGPTVVDFSSKKKSAGRFLGCGKLKDVGVKDAELAAKILDKPDLFYFTFHQNKTGSGVFKNSIRGQLT